MTEKKDDGNRAHYKIGDTGLEAIDVIEKMGLGYQYCVGCMVKYLTRLGVKHEDLEEDLVKIHWYADRALKNLPGLPVPVHPQKLPDSDIEALSVICGLGHGLPYLLGSLFIALIDAQEEKNRVTYLSVARHIAKQALDLVRSNKHRAA